MRVRRRPRTGALLLVGAVLLTAACRGPAAPEVLVDLHTPMGLVHGVSTEAGILTLDEVVGEETSLALDYQVGNGRFQDRATVEARQDLLALLRPVSSRLQQIRFAAWPAEQGDRLFVEYRMADRNTVLSPVRLLEEGQVGELIVPSVVGPIAQLAGQWAGAGVLAWRQGHLQLVGILNGVYTEDPRALAFLGLEEICRTLPQALPYLDRSSLPRRADFEYGLPRDPTREGPVDDDGSTPDSPARDDS